MRFSVGSRFLFTILTLTHSLVVILISNQILLTMYFGWAWLLLTYTTPQSAFTLLKASDCFSRYSDGCTRTRPFLGNNKISVNNMINKSNYYLQMSSVNIYSVHVINNCYLTRLNAVGFFFVVVFNLSLFRYTCVRVSISKYHIW